MKKIFFSLLILLIFPVQSFANSQKIVSDLDGNVVIEFIQKILYKYKIFSTGKSAKTYNGYTLRKSVKVKDGYIGFY